MHIHVGLLRAGTRSKHLCKCSVKTACVALRDGGSNVWLPMNYYLPRIPQALRRKQWDWLLLSQSRKEKMAKYVGRHLALLWDWNCKLADYECCFVLLFISMSKNFTFGHQSYCSDFALCSLLVYRKLQDFLVAKCFHLLNISDIDFRQVSKYISLSWFKLIFRQSLHLLAEINRRRWQRLCCMKAFQSLPQSPNHNGLRMIGYNVTKCLTKSRRKSNECHGHLFLFVIRSSIPFHRFHRSILVLLYQILPLK